MLFQSVCVLITVVVIYLVAQIMWYSFCKMRMMARLRAKECFRVMKRRMGEDKEE